MSLASRSHREIDIRCSRTANPATRQVGLKRGDNVKKWLALGQPLGGQGRLLREGNIELSLQGLGSPSNQGGGEHP